uniref:SID1 transmembrane family member 1 n=1 Tax=Caenorhabditis tropicalis TaxID=1561998 RepID=A0A1I7TYN6_9PELO
MVSRRAASCLLIALLRFGCLSQNVTGDIDADSGENSHGPIVKQLSSKKKMFNETLQADTVHVLYMTLDQSYIFDLMRVAVDVINPVLYKKETDSILEVAVSNGRDNFNFKLPVIYPDLTLYSYGKLLNPLLDEDFGPRISKKKRNSSVNQTLLVTVQSRLKVDIDYTLHLTHLDRSQYYLKFKPDESTKTLSNQKLTFVKPMGFFLDAVEENVKSFHITLKSDDDICATIITVPANESIYDRPVDADKPDNQRYLTFTKRADVFFSHNEIESFRSFRIFVFISPVNTPCSSNSSRKSFNEIKKITFEFTKLEPSSYSLPILAMIMFLMSPALLFVPFVITYVRQSSGTVSESNLISIGENDRHNVSSNVGESAQNSEETREIILIPEEQNLEVQDNNTIAVINNEDSLSLHGQVLKYPIAIILPVLMHTAIEFHEWTSSSMANRDEMCFHNNACARPYGELRAWNNIISNLGYAIYGSVFVAITMCRRWRNQNSSCGIFECTLLDVTIGLFMVLQAIASATYHICPSDVAFQFDTPCIQVICGLLIIRQWLVRQESPSAAYTNILLLGVVSLNFLISALSKSHVIRYLISVNHIGTIAVLCFAKSRTLGTRNKLSHMFTAAFVSVNLLIMCTYVFSSVIHINQIVTYCFIVNCILYLTYYSSMKVASRERIGLKAKVCGALSVAGWIIAAFFFFQDDTDWTRTAAASRALNKPCLLLDFFGSHDLWHIFGALAGLFTFLFVSFVDDDLINVPKCSINVY